MTTTYTEQSELLALIGTLAEAYTKGDAEGVMSFFSEDAVFENFDGLCCVTHETIREATQQIMSMGQLRFAVKDAVAEESTGKVVTHWQLTVSPSTGSAFDIEGVDILHWKSGKLAYKSTLLKTEAPKLFLPQ